MVRARDEAIRGKRDDQSAQRLLFDCGYCKRPAECRLPAVDEDGHTPLAPSDIVDIYNERRFKHYLTDFDDHTALRDHLLDRARYWTQGKSGAEVEAAMNTVGPCVEWWEIAHPAHKEARRAIARIEDLQLAAEAKKFAGLTPKEKFAMIRRQLASVAVGMDLSQATQDPQLHSDEEVHKFLMNEDLWEGEDWARPGQF